MDACILAGFWRILSRRTLIHSSSALGCSREPTYVVESRSAISHLYMVDMQSVARRLNPVSRNARIRVVVYIAHPTSLLLSIQCSRSMGVRPLLFYLPALLLSSRAAGRANGYRLGQDAHGAVARDGGRGKGKGKSEGSGLDSEQDSDEPISTWGYVLGVLGWLTKHASSSPPHIAVGASSSRSSTPPSAPSNSYSGLQASSSSTTQTISIPPPPISSTSSPAFGSALQMHTSIAPTAGSTSATVAGTPTRIASASSLPQSQGRPSSAAVAGVVASSVIVLTVCLGLIARRLFRARRQRGAEILAPRSYDTASGALASTGGAAGDGVLRMKWAVGTGAGAGAAAAAEQPPLEHAGGGAGEQRTDNLALAREQNDALRERIRALEQEMRTLSWAGVELPGQSPPGYTSV
ncbi:hypothetical protein GGX14DRAFT_575253 [Mycena pura]|uniref:Uncharacterized protein n=1 Tax=Mycena pura TaxID=153505 RepID=A0AAD6UVW3_9AGAR|nr:hypothetical protein GGX14DRAFT_575253 [Mycena pura]